MSASPTQPANSAKRPLEETSSPSRSNDQPDAKRPALDKILKSDEEVEMAQPLDATTIPSTDVNGADKTNGADTKSEAGDEGAEGSETKPIQSSVAGSVPATSTPSASHDERDWIHIRAVISSPEAATVIGKGGENVSNIRKMSGAKCTVSDYQKGAVERILTVSGVVDAAAKAFGLIIRTLNNEPLAEPSSAQSKTYPLRLLIPHILIGSIIGKGGARIREIQEASGARLNASDSCLPLSTERSLVVMGVADAVHIATYYVGSTLLEQLNDRFGGPAASAYATRSGGPAGVVPGGMQVVPYSPQPTTGNYGNRDNYNRRHDARAQHHGLPAAPYGAQPYPHQAAQPNPAMPIHYGAAQAGGYGAAAPMQPHAGAAIPQPHGAHPAQPVHGGAMPGAPLTQQIYIPNDMVGAIIGKGGQKINEIRQISGSVIKINEPQDNSNERLVTITGTEECNRMALYMLYSRLGKQIEAKVSRVEQSANKYNRIGKTPDLALTTFMTLLTIKF
ncbi:KH domain-containing protein [Colletotrichum cuscutae]|uniref:KH domain-containing protein n=1 Tax=Colletotrichum cuscutae TaxID=1209917 RepID=A0AAI9V8H3_9PEZI|nr:KH domain-containing protein [Colletotrichum cuscutae]